MSLSNNFYRLIYVSVSDPLTDVRTILVSARKNNLENGITGGLGLLDGIFIQYLEGPQTSVKAIFARISGDRRHKGIKLLEERAVPGRMFTDWSMAQLKWTDQTKVIFRSFSPGIELKLYETDPSTAAPLFRAWAATNDWMPLR